MPCLRTLLVLLLINVTAFGQCVVNSTEPPQFYSSGLPVAWPKTNVYSAPTYVGHVEYFVYCGYIQDQNGNDYWSCPSAALNNDIDTAIGNWDAASDSNGSTVHFVFVSQRPEDPGTCGPTPCFPTRTPYIEFLQQRHDDLIAAHPGVIAFTPTDWTDYGCQSPLCPYQVGPYYRNALATVVFSDHITNDHYAQFVMAHEIGHTFALGDCTGCDTTTTVMTSSTISVNDPAMGLTGPAYCDNLQVTNSDVALFFRSPFLKRFSSKLLALVSGGASAKPSGYMSKWKVSAEARTVATK